MSAVTTTPSDYDLMTEVIERAIGPNDQYPSAIELAVHRAKQALQEKHFKNQDITKEPR
jgi:hypothetical protein